MPRRSDFGAFSGPPTGRDQVESDGRRKACFHVIVWASGPVGVRGWGSCLPRPSTPPAEIIWAGSGAHVREESCQTRIGISDRWSKRPSRQARCPDISSHAKTRGFQGNDDSEIAKWRKPRANSFCSDDDGGRSVYSCEILPLDYRWRPNSRVLPCFPHESFPVIQRGEEGEGPGGKFPCQ